VKFIVILGVLLSSLPAIAEPLDQALIEPLPASAAFRGCGCTFTSPAVSSAPEAAIVFSSNYDGSARIASRGAIVDLTATRPDVDCQPARAGGRCALKYRGNGLRVVIKARATWVCPDDDTSESCEVVRLSGQMTAQVADVERTVEVSGDCGC